MFIMAIKIKLFSLENEEDDPEFIGPIDMDEGESFACATTGKTRRGGYY